MNLCDYCGNNLENEWHIFFVYQQVRSVWEEAGVWHHVSSGMAIAESATKLIFHLLETLPMKLQRMFNIIL